MLLCCIPAEFSTSSVDYFISENEGWQGSWTDSKRALGDTVEKQGLVPLYNMLKICLDFTRDPIQAQGNTKLKVSVVYFFTAVYFWSEQHPTKRYQALRFHTSFVGILHILLKRLKNILKVCFHLMRIAFSNRSLKNKTLQLIQGSTTKCKLV